MPTSDRARWLNNYERETFPYALLYSVNGRYTFRCRDDQNGFVESSGPDGNPLQLTLSNGKAIIWHFDMTAEKMAHVFVVTAIPLQTINGEELMEKVRNNSVQDSCSSTFAMIRGFLGILRTPILTFSAIHSGGSVWKNTARP
jgi:hypothetical protein